MKTTLKIVLLLVAGLLALPATLGLLARPAFDQMVRNIEQRHGGLGDITEQRTNHGWFETTRRVSVVVAEPAARALLAGFLDDAPADAPVVLNLDIALRHGPLPLARGTGQALSPALGHTRLTWQVQQGDHSVRLPLSVLARSGPRRSDWTVLLAPRDYALSATSAAQVRHTGARLDGTVANDGTAVAGSGTLGSLVVGGTQGRRFEAHGGQFEFALTRPAFAPASGETTFQFDALSVARADSTAVTTMTDVALVTELAVLEQRLNGSTQLRVGAARVNEVQQSSGGHATLNYEADAQASAALAAYIAALVAGRPADTGPPLVGELATRGVTVAVPELHFDTPEGALTARMDGTLPAGDGDARDMLQRSAGTAKISVPVTLLRRIMASSPDIEATLQYALQTGLVQRQRDVYVSDWRLRDGALRINGRPVPLPL